MKLQLAQGSGEWSALYVDGELKEMGDHYICEEAIYELVGVEIIETDLFTYKDGQTGVPTWQGVINNIDNAKAKREAAEELRRQAKKLMDKAADLEETI